MTKETGVTILRKELENERGFPFSDSEWLEYMDNSITIATLRAMQEYATQEKQGWVKGGTLPNNGRDVLVSDDESDIVAVGHYSASIGNWFVPGYKYLVPTMWHELPQKPEV